jgi:hypothetical protein
MYFTHIASFTCSVPPTAVTIVDDFLDPPVPEEEIDRIAEMRDKNVPGRYNWTTKEELPTISRDLYRFYKRAVEVMGFE